MAEGHPKRRSEQGRYEVRRRNGEAGRSGWVPIFESHEWRLLFYLGQYPISALANPSFDAVAAFHEIFDQDPSYNEVPLEWTGSSKPAASVLVDLRTIISDMPPDVAKAAWSILGFARSLGLEKHEALMVPWWKPWWIGYYLEAARYLLRRAVNRSACYLC